MSAKGRGFCNLTLSHPRPRATSLEPGSRLVTAEQKRRRPVPARIGGTPTAHHKRRESRASSIPCEAPHLPEGRVRPDLRCDIERIRDDSGEGGRLRYRLRVRYRYAAGGQELTGDRLSFFGSSVHSTRTLAAAHRNRIIRGDKIDVWYDPANPSQSVNDRGIPWAFWFAFAIGVIFLLGGSLPLLLGRVRG